MMLRPKSTTDIRRLQGISTVATRPRQRGPASRSATHDSSAWPGPAAGREQPLLVAGEPRHRQVVPVPPEREHAAGLEDAERLGRSRAPGRSSGTTARRSRGRTGRPRSGSALPSPTTGQHARRRPRRGAPGARPRPGSTAVDGGAAAGEGAATRCRCPHRRRRPRPTAAAGPSPTPARRTAAPGSRAGRRRSRRRRASNSWRSVIGPVTAVPAAAARLSRANASPSARSASRSSRFTARRVLTSSTTVPRRSRRAPAAPAPRRTAGRRDPAPGARPCSTRAVGEVDVRQPVAERLDDPHRVRARRPPCARGRAWSPGSRARAGPSAAGRPRSRGCGPATGTCSRRRTPRRSRSASGAARRRTRGRTPAASETAGARRRWRRRPARPPSWARCSLVQGSVDQTRWVSSRHGAWIASTGTPNRSDSAAQGVRVLAHRVGPDHHLDAVEAEVGSHLEGGRAGLRVAGRGGQGDLRARHPHRPLHDRQPMPSAASGAVHPVEPAQDDALAQRPGADLHLVERRAGPSPPRPRRRRRAAAAPGRARHPGSSARSSYGHRRRASAPTRRGRPALSIRGTSLPSADRRGTGEPGELLERLRRADGWSALAQRLERAQRPATSARTCLRSALTSCPTGGSPGSTSRVSRPAPSGSDAITSGSSSMPAAISSDPPPMSMHQQPAGRPAEPPPDREERQPRLVRPGQHLQVDAGLGRGPRRAPPRRSVPRAAPRWRRPAGPRCPGPRRPPARRRTALDQRVDARRRRCCPSSVRCSARRSSVLSE